MKPAMTMRGASVAAGLAGLALALALIAAAVPRLSAALAAIPAQALLTRLDRGAAVAPAAVAAALAQAGVPAPARARLGAWLRARGGAIPAADVLAAHRAALARVPADPYLWLGLARAAAQTSGQDDLARRAYGMSLASAPALRAITHDRLDLGLWLWPGLSPALRDGTDRQIRLLAGFELVNLTRLARRRHALGPVRAALAGDPERLAAFDAAYWARR